MTTPQLSISQNALEMFAEIGNVMPKYVFLFFKHIFTGILIFKVLTARRLYKSFGVKGLSTASAAMVGSFHEQYGRGL
jgi:hypothetical protein